MTRRRAGFVAALLVGIATLLGPNRPAEAFDRWCADVYLPIPPDPHVPPEVPTYIGVCIEAP